MKNKTLIIILAVIAAIVLMAVGQYNGLVRAREDSKAAWAQVENQMQRRNDLIPNYVNTVKGYAKHEKDIFIEIADARSRLLGAGTMTERAGADAAMSGALGRLMAIAENYPQLKADQNFLRLQDELAGTENRIAVERKRYNDLVNSFNKKILVFPASLFARLLGFERLEFFQPAPEAKQVPKVEF
jgi:LemA protein